MTKPLLPSAFAELARFVAKWDAPSTNERYAIRLSSSMKEMQALYDAIAPRIEDIKAHLDAKSFDAYTDADRRLARLMFAWVHVAEAIEVFKQPRVPDSKMYWDVQVEPDL